MRLKKIKLAGFKTFVDPTTLEFRGNLFSIVGPNGCGKSNIIDAIKWVMGETSAKSLRGEALTDVIFNGSGARHPVGQASVELLFDNSDCRIGGEFAAYNEIAVRRLATREDPSAYFLNGTRCRRRDIIDLFLGTGIGARSYAVIEQGMISRIIEAKPEDLRSFLEEAAGISLYRKRRHETELRMQHTRDNLDRLNDIRQELEKQLERLKRQAQAAERYHQYKEEALRLESELTTLRLKLLESNHLELQRGIRKQSEIFEEKQSDKTAINLELEKLHLAQAENQAACDKAQAQYYEMGNQVSRAEQDLNHHQEKRQSLEIDIAQMAQLLETVAEQLNFDEARIQQSREKLNVLKDPLEKCVAEKEGVFKAVQEMETALREETERFEQFLKESIKPQQLAEREKARIEQLEKQSYHLVSTVKRLEEEKEKLNIAELTQTLNECEQGLVAEEKGVQSILDALEKVTDKIKTLREQHQSCYVALNELNEKHQHMEGRLSSLETLQEEALSKSNPDFATLLESLGMGSAKRLGEVLTVESGYEAAVETVLKGMLEAVLVSGLDTLLDKIGASTASDYIILDLNKLERKGLPTSSRGNAVLLSSKITCEFPLAGLFKNIYGVSTLAEALDLQSSLNDEESVVTKDGIWLAPAWVKVYRKESLSEGILLREKELKQLKQDILGVEEALRLKNEEAKTTEIEINTLEHERESLLSTERDKRTHQNLASKKVADSAARLSNARKRLAQIDEERALNQKQLTTAENETAEARISLQTAINEMDGYQLKRQQLVAERDKLKDLLTAGQNQKRLIEERAHHLALEETTFKTEIRGLEEGLARLQDQKTRSLEKIAVLKSSLEAHQLPEQGLKETLAKRLNERMKAEKILGEARDGLSEVMNQSLNFEQKRKSVDESLDSVRGQLEQLRLEAQTLEVHRENLIEKLKSLNLNFEEMLERLPADMDEARWAENLAEVTQKIARLGAINLVAIEEFQSEQERKLYLDKQHEDLTSALATLEAAIVKIDKETRERFDETLSKVNTFFQDLFSRLFEGGQAALELTGEDVLQTGIQVKARPPGKRNSSIHLLSGGEKALTAIALVFSFFHLNPAPFCILDEVDAPLDDVNVGRFCRLVKQMSEKIQFIYVTHNKLTMEMADSLVGVTMHEQGVSRLVSVDIAEAVAAAQVA